MLYITETVELNKETRSKISGEFIELSAGVTRYEIAGPKNGQPIVFINGFSVPYYLWDHNFEYLAENGFRVIRYDLYGRGGSDRPNTTYNIELFRTQLSELIDHLVPKNKKVNISAICMGAILAADYCCENPSRVNKISLIGPAGLPGSLPNHNWLTKIPLWGDYLMQIWGDQELISGLKKHLFRFDLFPEYKEKYIQFMNFKGIKRALLSTNRNMNVDDTTKLYQKLAPLKKDILLIWGIEDAIVPIRLSEKLTSLIPKATFRSITDAGHLANYEKPEKANKMLMEFFK